VHLIVLDDEHLAGVVLTGNVLAVRYESQPRS
jgi:hypothetical protein